MQFLSYLFSFVFLDVFASIGHLDGYLRIRGVRHNVLDRGWGWGAE